MKNRLALNSSHLFFLIGLLFLLISSQKLFAKVIIGHESSKFLSSKIAENQQSGLQQSIFYLNPQVNWQNEESGLLFDFDLKISYPFLQNNHCPNEKTVLSPNSIYLLKKIDGHNKISYGFKKYSFSETFGVNIVDLVNPINFSNYPFSDFENSKIATEVIDYSFQYQSTKILLIYNINPLSNKYPDATSPYNPMSEIGWNERDEDERFQNKEYGLRATHLLESGIDLGMVYYHHYPRYNESYFDLQTLSFKPITKTINSYAVTFSYAFNHFYDLVIRGDTLFQPKSYFLQSQYPYQLEEKRRVQLIYGADKIFPEADNMMIGAQIHFDSHQNLFWNSWLIRYQMFSERVEISPIIFFGINNPDLWIRPKATYLISENGQLKIDLSLDLILSKGKEKNKERGMINRFKDKDQIRLDLSYEIN